MTCRFLIPLIALAFATSCDSPLVEEAKEAEGDGRTISNEMMRTMYPSSFTPGEPEYLERDFEAGADFICAEIRANYDRDICSEPEINWQ